LTQAQQRPVEETNPGRDELAHLELNGGDRRGQTSQPPVELRLRPADREDWRSDTRHVITCATASAISS
jgi:hypothetical protein